MVARTSPSCPAKRMSRWTEEIRKVPVTPVLSTVQFCTVMTSPTLAPRTYGQAAG